MKTNHEKNARWAIVFVLIVIVLIVFFSFRAYTQETKGYLVCTVVDGHTKCNKTPNIEHVQKMVDIRCKALTIDVEKQLSKSNFLEIRTEHSTLYIEKKRIVKKRGKIKYKKLKR